MPRQTDASSQESSRSNIAPVLLLTGWSASYRTSRIRYEKAQACVTTDRAKIRTCNPRADNYKEADNSCERDTCSRSLVCAMRVQRTLV